MFGLLLTRSACVAVVSVHYCDIFVLCLSLLQLVGSETVASAGQDVCCSYAHMSSMVHVAQTLKLHLQMCHSVLSEILCGSR